MLISFLVIAMMVVSFFCGVLWGEQSFLGKPRYKLNSAIEIQESPAHIGKVPANSILYEYQTLPETTIYILFINMLKNSALELQQDSNKKSLIDPVSGYPYAE